MNKPTYLALAGVLCLLAACSGTPEPESVFQPNPLTGEGTEVEETPMDERISGLLQESKQQYDEGHYSMSFKLAQQVESLIVEHNFPVEDEAMALTIQGYCLLQIGRIDDYFVSTHGVQKGAVTKFERVLELNEDDFRAHLGMALCRFRRHGDSILKSDALADGVYSLESVREDFKRGLDKEGKARLRDGQRKLELFKGIHEKLSSLHYIFRDPATVPLSEKGGADAKWLGTLSEAKSVLAINDLLFVMEDAVKSGAADDDDRRAFDANCKALADSWRAVRNYWRLQALTELQKSRDGLLRVRELDARIVKETGRMVYLWVDRDLTFVFQSLGAFFLDSGLEKARLQAISEGVTSERQYARAKELYLDPEFKSADKDNSRRNYEAALSYTKSFVIKHKAFEKLRTDRRDEALSDEDNSNPFMVDLVRRYRETMDEMIQTEKAVRTEMVLEAAVLCIEPLFQLSDVTEANVWANELKSMNPGDPIHHFVRATAYYHTGDFETAKLEYEAFMPRSSISQDANRRALARQRIMQCEQQLARKAGAGEGEAE